MLLPPPDVPCPGILADLAIAFRDPEERHTYVARNPDFPAWLRDAVQRIARDNADTDEQIQLFKLVANFVADDGKLHDNRTIICEQTSLLEAINLLLDKINNSPTPEYNLVKPFLAAILNLVLSPTYSAPRTHLLTHASWTRLVILANRTYRPCEPVDDTQHVQVGERATLASWAWKIVLAILETTPDTETTTETVIPATEDIPILERTTIDLCAPLEYFSCPSPGAAPRDAETMSEDLDILGDCTTVLQILCTTPAGVRAFVPVLQNEQEAGRWLVGFVEYGEVVDGWVDSEDPDSDEGGDPASRPGEKALGRAKASLMACLAELCASSEIELFGDVGQRGGWFWDVLVRWAGSARDDLVSCALLCIGNYINDDTKARQIASQPHLISHLVNLLDSAHPGTPAQQTHALLGLLRNLVLAPGTEVKLQLASHVVRAVSRMGVFDPTRDLVASVQGGAVGLLRLLSRGDEHTARTVAAEPELLKQIMDLWTRTDDQSIKIEISRLVAAIARAQSPRTGEEPIPEPVIRDARELAALTMLVALGSSQEILLAEGVLALALIANSAHGARAVLRVLAGPDDTALSTLKTYVSTPRAPPSVISNICIFLLNLANGRDGGALGKTDSAGTDDVVERQVGDILVAISEREDVDDALRIVVQTAQVAWR